MKTSILNKQGVVVEVGKTYYYYNIGLSEVKTHNVIYFADGYQNAVDHNGKVSVDSLFEKESDVKNPY